MGKKTKPPKHHPFTAPDALAIAINVDLRKVSFANRVISEYTTLSKQAPALAELVTSRARKAMSQ